MGIKGSATCVMNFDGARGWLVGEENKGLAAMFTMMNYERLGVGIQGIGAAEASLQSAREYALERIQSRAPTGAQQPEKAADPILVHPDVRRMLLTMKGYVEGGVHSPPMSLSGWISPSIPTMTNAASMPRAWWRC